MDCCHDMGAPPLQMAMLFSTGLLMSVSHCIGMCGPIVGAFGISQGAAGVRLPGRVVALVLYHGGRLVSYGLIGWIMGSAGASLGLAPIATDAQGWLSLVLGLAMLVGSFGLLGIVSWPSWLNRRPGASFASRAMSALLRGSAASGRVPGAGCSLLLGAANGFLPCGPVATVSLSAAAAAQPFLGVRAMLAYGAGTVPALIAVGLGAAALSARGRGRLYRIGGILLALVSVQLVLRGLHALGLVPPLRVGSVVIW